MNQTVKFFISIAAVAIGVCGVAHADENTDRPQMYANMGPEQYCDSVGSIAETYIELKGTSSLDDFIKFYKSAGSESNFPAAVTSRQISVSTDVSHRDGLTKKAAYEKYNSECLKGHWYEKDVPIGHRSSHPESDNYCYLMGLMSKVDFGFKREITLDTVIGGDKLSHDPFDHQPGVMAREIAIATEIYNTDGLTAESAYEKYKSECRNEDWYYSDVPRIGGYSYISEHRARLSAAAATKGGN